MPMTSQEMIKLLLKNGFAIISQNGSHVKLKNTDTHKTVIVPYHCKDIKKDTLSSAFFYIFIFILHSLFPLRHPAIPVKN